MSAPFEQAGLDQVLGTLDFPQGIVEWWFIQPLVLTDGWESDPDILLPLEDPLPPPTTAWAQGSTTSVSAAPRLRLNATAVVNLLATTLAAATVADALRGPIVQSEKTRPQVVAAQQANLLTSTLETQAAEPIPPGRTGLGVTPRKARVYLDTSSGMSPVLYVVQAEAAPPGQAAPAAAPRLLRAYADTSTAATPLRIQSVDWQRGPLLQAAKRKPATPGDTSASSPLPLVAVIQAGDPIVPARALDAPAPRRLIQNTSASSPLGLMAPPAAPDTTVMRVPLTVSPHKRLAVLSTAPGGSSPALLDSQPAVPPDLAVEQLNFAPQRKLAIGSETSRASPLALLAPATQVAHQFRDPLLFNAKLRKSPVTDTSQSSPLTLTFVELPGDMASEYMMISAPPRRVVYSDTTRGTPKALQAEPVATDPVIPDWMTWTPRRPWSAQNTSASSPATLVYPPTPPADNTVMRVALRFEQQTKPWRVASDQLGTSLILVNFLQDLPSEQLQLYAPERRRPVVDTSRGTPKTLLAEPPVLPPPVGNPTPHFGPVYRTRIVLDSCVGTSRGLIDDEPGPVTPTTLWARKQVLMRRKIL